MNHDERQTIRLTLDRLMAVRIDVMLSVYFVMGRLVSSGKPRADMTTSWPRNASVSSDGSKMSATTVRRFGWQKVGGLKTCVIFFMLRIIAVTWWPRSRSWRRAGIPESPVAPMRAIL